MDRGRGGNRGGRGGGGGRYYAPRGRSPRSTGRHCCEFQVAHPDGASPGSGSSEIGKINSEISSVDGVTKKFSGLLTSDYLHGPNAVPHGVGNMSPNNGNSKLAESVSEAENQTPKPLDLPSVVGPDCGLLDGQVPQEFQRGKCTSEVTGGKGEYEKSDFQQYGFSFDICEERDKNIPKLKTPLLVKNRAMRSEMKRQAQGVNIQTFRSGMILLKGYISLKDQVKLIKSCRDLGRGHGGFYQPGYRDGAKLHLKMMCLGKNWDPETSMYGDKRPIDDAKPPPIPDDFQQMVKEALQECHGYLESHSKVRNVRDILPSMSPSICIINFYTNNGKLGLHQDKDESQESIRKRLPVVSFSLGDSAEFLYGEQRDIDKADKVVLESGDVLVFGGESRLIFHGVSNIIPDTAPKPLLEETDLRPGRLNLTFREY
ncbi:hypothetical protein DH2020_041554 [Rehmannia glutinosa]|uniref:Fe2OG dioxygenase domain-containing protein n=1 Tax=Rehmannia glutinosa TaxID=99300 RepID=A0ABR0UPU6_REHGL